jgi:2-C-methyl-D-erythritol 4-phosphate cytidylyltransferase
MSKVVAIVLCGGSGRRAGAANNKVYLPVGGRPMVTWSVETFRSSPLVNEVYVVAAPAERTLAADILGTAVSGIIDGGATRHQSEANAVAVLADRISSGEIEIVMIHDGARPFFVASRLGELVEAARRSGGAIFALPLGEDLLVTDDDRLKGLESRAGLWRALTPQAFQASPLLDAFRAADDDGWEGTDTASTFERGEGRVAVVLGDPENVKVTWPEDFAVAESIAGAREPLA